MIKRYVYKDKKWVNEGQLRQELFKDHRVVFGTFNDVVCSRFGIAIEEYNPEDVLTDEQRADHARKRRDVLLQACDYYVMPDYPSDPETLEAVKIYRQQLRDITGQHDFPKNIQWPEMPAVLGA